MTVERRHFPHQLAMAMVLLLVLLIDTTVAFPYMTIDSMYNEKCVTAEFPMHTMITLRYKFLDFAERDHYYIRLFPHLDEGDDAFGSGDNFFEEEIGNSTGVIKYDKHLERGMHQHEVRICVRRERGAIEVNPVFFSIRISENYEEDLMDVMADEMGEMPKPDAPIPGGDKNAEKDRAAASEHMNYLEKTILRMVQSTDYLIEAAEIAKDEEDDFSNELEDMYSAAKYWPIMHLLILFVTGYTQANHIVSFFKSRHII